MSDWKPKAAAEYMRRAVGLAYARGESIAAGSLSYAILVDQSWCCQQLFELAMARHLNATRDEVAEHVAAVLADDEPTGDACDYCGRELRIPDYSCGYRVTEKGENEGRAA